MSAMEQLGFDAMPRRLFRATPTRLTSWLDCPRRYRFTYLDRPTPPKGPPWAHNSVGASVHTALAAWWRLPVEGRTPEAAGQIARRSWIDEGFRDDAQSERWWEYAAGLVENYVTRLDPDDDPIGVERTVALTTGTLALSGRVDRIDLRPEGFRNDLDDDDDDDDGDDPDDDNVDDADRDSDEVELVVVDYKTGRRVLTTADARGSLALAVYAAAAARTLRRPCRRVELHHLPTGSVVAWDHTPESFRRHLDRADQVGEEAAEAGAAYAQGLSAAEQDRIFPPRPGPQCQWCDFAARCPEGRTAFPTLRPWDGLAPDIG
ncbi:RecB family exonuclease [Actinopolymorpha pittospori]|uniref:RecB family exonuclease n=1 Tax=Actinopolymorpha pittospori TaxID=648752 RepID=A0A927NBH4_9ACTN|nr:PD-(D/E)XK nuclease family protein [Actinopolymorpha pittospori]MBE1611770.1 RecB family exonuclease [Actinopolymorpha pittospori]